MEWYASEYCFSSGSRYSKSWGGVFHCWGGGASTFLALFLMKVKMTMRTGEQLQLGERRPDSASFRVSALYFLLEV